MGSEGRTVQVGEGKKLWGGEAAPAGPHVQTMERGSSHDRMNSDTSIHTNDDPVAQEGFVPSQPDAEIHVAPTIMSPKCNK